MDMEATIAADRYEIETLGVRSPRSGMTLLPGAVREVPG